MPIARADWPRLLNLVEQALDQPASERDGWLQSLDLPAPLLATLLSLLEERRAIETGDFLGALPAITPGDRPGLRSGTLIGPWRLLREVGQGGMSTVWLAERADAQLNRQVALKMPHAGPGQDQLAARLLRERNILAALEHRNIARLYDVGLTDAGTPFLVMEYVAGDTLLAHADRLQLDIPQRLALFQQVLRAVQYAHGKLVLHRDLKPSNILVNEAGDVKLLDFGIAKLLAAEGHTHDDTELTRSAGRQLTPAYASPEQLRGEALGTASDVYSLGVVLHELLSGERPFAQHRGSALRMEDAVLHQDVRSLSRLTPAATTLAARSSSFAQWRQAVTGDLDAIVLKALGKTIADRYASADLLATDLAHWLAHEPVSVTAPSTWYHLRKFVMRHRLGVGLGSALAGLLLLTSTLAVLQSLRASEEALRANASRDFLLGIFEDTDPEVSSGGRDLSAKTLLERSRSKLLAAGAQNPVLPVPDLLRGIADAQVRLGDRVGALATLDRLLESLPARGAGAERITTLLYSANEAAQLNDQVQAKLRLQQALEHMQRDGASLAQWRQVAHATGMVALYDAEKIGAARQALQAYFDLADAPDSEPLSVQLFARVKLAKAESLLGNQAGALRQMRLAADFASRHQAQLGPRSEFHPMAAYRASLDGDWGQYATVLSWLPEVIDRCQRSLGPDHEDCLDLIGHAIRAWLKVGDFPEAARVATRLGPQADNSSSPRRQIEAAVLMARAYALTQATDRLSFARHQLEQLVRQEGVAQLPAPLRLQGMNTLAELALLTEDPRRAMVWTSQARALQQNAGLSPASREVMKTALFEGIAWQAQGQHAQAMSQLAPFCDESRLAQSRQLAVLDRLFSLNCVQSLRVLEQPQRAERLIEQALPILLPALGHESPTYRRAEALHNPPSTTSRTSGQTPKLPSFFN